MSYVVIWLQACLHWRSAYFQTVSWSYTIFVVDWDILYKLCGSADKWSKGFVFPGKIWWQFFSCNKACSKYHTRSTTTPKYTLTQRLVFDFGQGLRCALSIRHCRCHWIMAAWFVFLHFFLVPLCHITKSGLSLNNKEILCREHVKL